MLHTNGSLSNNKAITVIFPYRIRSTTHNVNSKYPPRSSKSFFCFITQSVIYNTGARCKCPLSSNLTKCLTLSIIPCTRNITNDLGFNTCFLISPAVRYIRVIKLIFLQFILLSFPLHFPTVTRNTFRQTSSCRQ